MRATAVKEISVRWSLPLFLAVVVCLAVWQVRLTWRLLEQERNLTADRTRERLEQTADLAVAQISSALDGWSFRLREMVASSNPATTAKSPPPNITFIVIRDHTVTTYPARTLLFVPDPPDPPPLAESFATASRLEFQEQNYLRTLQALRELTGHPGAASAEAWLRIARIEHRLHHLAAAQAAYDRLLTETTLSPDGVPYALLSATARSELKPPDNSAQLQFLRTALLQGRWPIRRETFQYYWTEVNRLRGAVNEPAPNNESEFAAQVSMLYEHWQQASRSGAESAGREAGPGTPLVIWSATPARLSAFEAPASWLASILKLPANSRDIHWRWSLSAGPAEASDPSVIRSLADAQLTGRLLFSTSPDSRPQDFNRALWLGGDGLMLLLVLAGAYTIYRGVTRELRVAQLQTDFVSAVSHEFRSPLTSLCSITELLTGDRLVDEGRRKRSYRFLERETRRLQRLVEDLLDFGQMESGRKQYAMRPCDPFDLVRNAVSEFKQEAVASDCEVEVNLVGNEPRVKTDEEALRRAIRNLLENALKYSPECKTVWVDGRVDEQGVLISVHDRGIGIETHEQRAIFQKFVRGEAAKRAGIKGTGIGLAMVDQIVKACGGKIKLESAAGQGSTFTILLPLAEDRD